MKIEIGNLPEQLEETEQLVKIETIEISALEMKNPRCTFKVKGVQNTIRVSGEHATDHSELESENMIKFYLEESEKKKLERLLRKRIAKK